jgi:ElaB/YqjD/DUF883 family membrane-anchored ribosome-binding protein
MAHSHAVDQYAAVIQEMLSNIEKVIDDSSMSSEDKLKAIEMITEACHEIAVAHVYMSSNH